MITPKETFEAAKVLYPEAIAIAPYKGRTVKIIEDAKSIYCEYVDIKATIDWGGLTQYPPAEKKWRPATKEDACRAIMEGGIECRVWEDISTSWVKTTLYGYDASGVSFPWLTEDDGWEFCEVPA